MTRQQPAEGLLADTCSPSNDKAMQVQGGIFRERAIMLLRRFYVQENGKGESVPAKEVLEMLTRRQHQSRTNEIAC
jgi:tRNA-specific adenosine deaminase 2